MRKWMVLMITLSLILVGCNRSSDQEKMIVISAATSLTEVTQELKKSFETTNPDWELNLTYNSSSTLAAQISQGAEVDLFLSADLRLMDELRREKLLEYDLIPFAFNRLAVGGSGINLNESDVLDFFRNYQGEVLVGNPDSVPLGYYTAQWFDEVGLDDIYQDRFIYADNAGDVLTLLEDQSEDVGVVYYSDAVTSAKLKWFSLMPSQHEDIGYYVAQVSSSGHKEQTRAVIDLLLSEEGQNLFKDFGFTLIDEKRTN